MSCVPRECRGTVQVDRHAPGSFSGRVFEDVPNTLSNPVVLKYIDPEYIRNRHQLRSVRNK